ncbi:MAG TPA: sigma-70 family RNA polymerase sigma factor [Alphaproteobacteria bacterium]|nr:sigma-70 family RNA polymerase sigma factor [Alphaproteobacteria bacterium]
MSTAKTTFGLLLNRQYKPLLTQQRFANLINPIDNAAASSLPPSKSLAKNSPPIDSAVIQQQQTEEALYLSGIAKGNIDDFKRLFAIYAPRLKNYLHNLGFSSSTAEELTQEIMITIWRSSGQYNPKLGLPSTWIYRIARNRGIDEFRRLKRQRKLISDQTDYVETLGDQLQDQHSMNYNERDQQKVLSFLSELPDNQQQIMQLFFFGNKSHQTIANELGIPLGTVKSRLRLAIDRLRNILLDEEKQP